MISRRTIIAASAVLPFYYRSATAAVLQSAGGDQTKALQAAISKGGEVQLGAGVFNVSTLTIDRDVVIRGAAGVTKIVTASGNPVAVLSGASRVTFEGLSFHSKGSKGQVVTAEGVERLVVDGCGFSGGETGLRLAGCGGRIVGSQFQFHEDVGLQSVDSKGLSISENQVNDIGNCGIQVWQTEKREDGSIVTGNHISRIAAKGGGTGQNGNGINIFNAGFVTVANNRISDCAFTGIRNNSGANSIITANSISRCNEVALYVEFSNDGSVVADNIVDTAATGIAIVNFDVGGRLSQCTGNIVRNITGNDPFGRPTGGGIVCEADVIVANNIIDVAKYYGIRLGWGPYGRNVQASNNTLLGCLRGIEFSMAGEGPYIIKNNIIGGAKLGSIFGMDYLKPVTSDLVENGATAPAHVSLDGNMVRN